MKRFKYSLENVLHYKEQILDSIKAEHGTLLAQIRNKEAEIQELENKLVSAQNKMDDLKKQDVQIKDICLYGMYISCLLYTSPSPRDGLLSRMPSSA